MAQLMLINREILLVQGKVALSADCCCQSCPKTCGGCPTEYDIDLNFSAPWDWLKLAGTAMTNSSGSCVWAVTPYIVLTAYPKTGVIDFVDLACVNGLWYITLQICATLDVTTGQYAICEFTSLGRAGVAPGCPPFGSYAFGTVTVLQSSDYPCPPSPTVTLIPTD